MGDTNNTNAKSPYAGYGNFGAGEIIAGPLVWGGLGWLVDGWLNTTPWLFVIGAILGFIAGVYLMYVKSKRQPGSQSETDQSTAFEGNGQMHPREG